MAGGRKRARSRRRIRRSGFEPLEPRLLLAADWRNPLISIDTNGDQSVSAVDALIAINELNESGAHSLTTPHQEGDPFLDVNGDDFVSAIDPLRVINALNEGFSLPLVLDETDRFANEKSFEIGLGQAAGGRTYRFSVAAEIDTSDDAPLLEDLLAVYLVDVNNRSQTLLSDEPGSPLFAYDGETVSAMPSQVSFDGSIVEVDLSPLAEMSAGQLVFQLLNNDGDQGTRVSISPLSNTVDPLGAQSPPSSTVPGRVDAVTSGEVPAVAPNADLVPHVDGVSFDPTTGRFVADLRIENQGAAVGPDIVVAFPGLPAGVTLLNRQTGFPGSDPVINMRNAIPSGGLQKNETSSVVRIEISNAAGTPFSLVPQVLDGDSTREMFFDFGSVSSPLSPGFTRVSNASQYTTAQGYGWTAGSIAAGDRGTASRLTRDFNYTKDGTFVVDLPNGHYAVDIILGDTVYAHDLVGVSLEGSQVASVTTTARQVVNKSFDVEVADGQLTLRLRDLGGGDVNAVIEGLRILSAGTRNPRSNAWWPARQDIPNTLFSARTKSGVYDYYTVDSTYQATSNNIRVLLPDGYDSQRDYPVIYVLPVELGNRTQFGDGMTTIYGHGLQRTTDAIFVAPTFSDHPWYADNAFSSSSWQETYFKSVIVPFVEEQYSVIDGREGRLLLGFSKSGYGAVAMMLRNPGYFGRVVAWDSPLAMSNPASGWGFVGVLGSHQNFHDNYQITKLLQTEGHHLIGEPARIFLQGYSYGFTRADHATIHSQMTALGIPHTYEAGGYRAHVWASGWMPDAVDALLADL